MYFITIKRMLEVCFSAHPNIQYRAFLIYLKTYFLKSTSKLTKRRPSTHTASKFRVFRDILKAAHRHTDDVTISMRH